MRMIKIVGAGALIAVSMALAAPSMSAEVKLKAIAAWGKNFPLVKLGFLRFIKQANAVGKGEYKIIHIGGPERLSRLELGHRVARVLGLAAEGIEAGFQVDYPGPDHRPADVSLDSGRARRELRWTPRPLEEALRGTRPAPDSVGEAKNKRS